MRSTVKKSFLYSALTAMAAIGGCTSGKSPAPPPAEAPADEPIDADFDEDGGEFTPSGPGFNYGGADIGDDTTKEEVQECHGEGNVYDRFEGDAGKCGKLKLAAIDCTVEALKALLTEKQKDQFNENLNDKYDGYEIDQCGDCEEDSSHKACGPSDGSAGIIVFFVKEVVAEEEIGGLTMFLPHRKPHDPSASNTNEGSIGDDDEDDESDETTDDESTDDEGTDTESTDAGGTDDEATDEEP